jgi:tRNA pseudouridine38-40 synthase
MYWCRTLKTNSQDKMYKYKIILEYDGTNYSGWQTQKNARSIQETLIVAAQKFLGSIAKIQGAGRTDAGVHASVSMITCRRA